MTNPEPFSQYQCLGLGRRALHQLRASLERDRGVQTATLLQEAGVAGGEGLYAAFAGWLQTAYGVMQPGDLDAAYLPEALKGFFGDYGWGTLTVSELAPAVMALDSEDWAEAAPDQGSSYPACHLTSGMLADFLGRMAQGQVAVMEVECRTRGDSRCRFLVGAPDSLSVLYDRMSRGLTYAEALGSGAEGGPAVRPHGRCFGVTSPNDVSIKILPCPLPIFPIIYPGPSASPGAGTRSWCPR